MPEPRPFSDIHGARADGLIPLGGGGSLPLIGAMDGVLTNTTAVRREITNQSQDLRLMAERQSRMSGALATVEHQAKELTKAVEDSLTQVAGTLVSQFGGAIDAAVKSAQAAQAAVEQHVVHTTKWLDQTNRPPGWVPPSPAAPPHRHISPARAESAASGGGLRLPNGMTPSQEGGEIESVANGDMWGRGRKIGVGELRGEFRQRMAARISNYSTVPMEERLIPQRDKEGNLTGHFRHPNGEYASTKDTMAYLERDKRGAVIRNYGASIFDAQSVPKGIANVLPGGIGKALGWAGVAYTVGNQVLDRAGQQREANNRFMRVEGGGQAAAAQERMTGAGFRMEQRLKQGFFGGLSGKDADSLFMGATQAGYRGDRREQALEFGAQNFKKYGMDVADTLELLTTAAQNGQNSLGDLSKALDGVTKAAVAGGVNAEEARKRFSQAYSSASQTFGGQGTAAVASGAVSAALTSLGEKYQGVGASGQFSNSIIQQIATEQNKTFNEVAEAQGVNGGRQYATWLQAHQQNAAMRKLGGDQSAFLAAKAAAGPRQANGKYSEEQIAKMGKSFEDMDDRSLVAILQGPEFGYTGVTPANVRGFMTNILSGNLNVSAQADRIAGEQQRYKTKAATAFEGKSGSVVKMALEGGAAEAGRAAGLRGDQASRPLGDTISKSWLWNIGGGHLNVDQGREQYQDLVAKGGTGVTKGFRSPMLEKFLKEGATENTRVKVRTKGGERVMTIKEALRSHPDEMERGDVEIVDGKEGWKGRTIADATGMAVDESLTETSSKKKQSGDKAGHDLDYWQKRWGSKDSGKGGTVTIEPSEYLKKLLVFRTTGGVQYGDTTPPVSDPGPAGRPSGNH